MVVFIRPKELPKIRGMPYLNPQIKLQTVKEQLVKKVKVFSDKRV